MKTLGRLYLLLFSLTVYGAFAQNTTITTNWGRIEKADNEAILLKVVAAGTWGTILARQEGRQVVLETYDARQQLRKTDLLRLPNGEGYQEIVNLRQRFFLITRRVDARNRVATLVRYELDRLTFSPYGEGLPLALVPFDERRRHRRLFDLTYATDSSQVLLYYQTPRGENDVERFSVSVLNDDLTPQWRRDLALSYADPLFHIQQYQVDVAGRVFVLGRLYQDRAQPTRNDAPNYRYVLLTITDADSEVRITEIGLGDYYISELSFRPNRYGNLIFAGFYSERNDQQVRGACYFRLDPSIPEIYDRQVVPFDLGFIADGYREIERTHGAPGAPELFHYRIRELILRSDGGVVLVAEQFFIEDHAQGLYLPGVDIPMRTFHYHDIIAVNLRPGGEIEWAVRVPKRQRTVNDSGLYAGFALVTTADGFYFVYNDHIHNYGPKANVDNIRNFTPHRSVLVATQVAKNGQVVNTPLFKNKDQSVIPRPRIGQQIGPRQLLLYGEDGQRYRLVRLQFGQ